MQAHDPLAVAHALDPFDFHPFAPFNGGAFAVFRSGGPVAVSEWEMHPDTDELLFVLEGHDTIEILGTDPGSASTLVPLTAGRFTIVPKGHWHRHRDVVDLVELYFTPGISLSSDDPDPRAAGATSTDVTPD
jgi:mannose-6-phosphate isomerase-like protein (cupin superfamily)